MKKIILSDFDHPIVKAKAAELTNKTAADKDKIQNIFNYVRDEIAFGFPANGDIMRASQTIVLKMGQCNTKSTLFLALCKAAGIPARIHFSTIKKEIQRGLFTGIAYRIMPDTLSHSWIEVKTDGEWIRIDSYINDKGFYAAGKYQLKKRKWNTGFSISCTSGESSADLNLNEEKFVQMDAVIDDHGVWDEPMDYYNSSLYKNRPGFIKLCMYRLMVGRINRRVKKLRIECFSNGLYGA